MIKKTNFFVLLAAVALLSSCDITLSLPILDETEVRDALVKEYVNEINPQVKNVILIVGDGMGTAQVYSSIVNQGENSQFLRFPYTGFSRTYSNNKYTTDSGAGGSALMTGHKVNNHAIAMSPEGDMFPSIFDIAKDYDMSTGFVVTSSVLDATPAATYAHVPYRKMYDTISLQMAQCSHDVMIGGDKNHFLPANRKDGLAPLDTLAKRGYDVVYTLDDMSKSNNGKICALLTDDSPAAAPARGDLLTTGVRKALAVLNRNPKGFALMIEGSQIDWACHSNDSAYLQAEMADFEKMLKVVLDFAKNDGSTLVIVTADHETGGLALVSGSIEEQRNDYRFITGGHSGVMVPVFAYGPGARWFTGVQQNVEIPGKILQLLFPPTAESTEEE